MKTRLGFVSNSSSSSFVVIAKSDMIPRGQWKNQPLNVGESGEREFGWDNKKYTSVYSRINFAYLQAMSVAEYDKSSEATKHKWLAMLEKVIKEYTGTPSIANLIEMEYGGKYWGYIDHQSCSSEGENTEIFESEESLKNFLFSRDSYIQGGNDNE